MVQTGSSSVISVPRKVIKPKAARTSPAASAVSKADTRLGKQNAESAAVKPKRIEPKG